MVYNKECFTEVKQVFLLYLWDSLVTLQLISLIPLVGPPHTDPLAVKLLDNRLHIRIQIRTIQLLIFTERFSPLPGFEPGTSPVPSRFAPYRAILASL